MGRLATYLASWLPRPQAVNGETSTVTSPTAWFVNALGGYLSRSNMLVGPNTALTLSTYYACLRNISEDVGKLPLFTYRRTDERTKTKAHEHPVYTLLHDAPNPDMTAMTFRQLLTQNVLGWGNGYAWIERDTVLGRRQLQQVKALWPLHPSQVTKRRLDDGQIVYDVQNTHSTLQPGTPIEVDRIPQADMLHIVGFTHNGQEGISVLQYAADSLGVALSAQDYGQAFFRNSAQPSGILKHPKILSKDAQERLRTDWKERFGQQGNGQQDIAVLEEGMEFLPLTIPNNQAQFLETREFQVREICRWFRMPPNKVADLSDAHYTNIEQENLYYVIDTLTSWLVRWEQTLKLRLFGLQSPYFAEHSVMGLLRGDSRARAMFYKDLFGLGAISPNEIRGFENENPLGTDGDETFISANNYRTLKSAVQMSTEPMAPTTGSRNGVVPAVPGRNGTTPHDDDEDDAEEED